MENKYMTTQIAKLIGIHSNTVKLYEKLGLITEPQRLSNGYRNFSNFHTEQFRLARTALEIEILQSGLRKRMIRIIKLSANAKYQDAIACTKDYIRQVRIEQKNVEEAIEITKKLLSGIQEKKIEMRVIIDSAQSNENIVTVCDKLLTSLSNAESNANRILNQLQAMQKK